jgi:hypothetical protein
MAPSPGHSAVRTTPEERALIDRAAQASRTDLTSFVITHLTDAARTVLADRDRFVLDADAAADSSPTDPSTSSSSSKTPATPSGPDQRALSSRPAAQHGEPILAPFRPVRGDR